MRAPGFYWLAYSASKGAPFIGQWQENYHRWAICGSDEDLNDDDDRLEILAGPLTPPKGRFSGEPK